ncbi:protein BIG GRAIN 1-like A [Gastrolobium bilobum]|uniref:protein BIG GRAIN 1-like A n=1 Tax=Gastrolobium bilobum TaxID=150636 RepID=UPI002AAF74B4|nr:protein BIG GRAIN 1-like A [Gastrolobium bilobum]
MPSFSSTLLDQIYRSIDEGERTSAETKFYRETMCKKQITSNGKRTEKTDRKDNNNKVVGTKMDRKTNHVDGDHDQHFPFFSSTSISSDSSSGGFSSSDTESMRSRASSCFAPPRPKAVRTSASFRLEKHGMRMFDGFCRNSNTEALIKSESRALKIYNNLKKVKKKQPVSPGGGRVTSFLNSLFATVNAKRSTRSTTYEEEDANAERKTKSGQASTCCSSASSFSRSCLSKTPSSERDNKLRNGVKRTVRFYPVSVIVGEDSRPCGHKSLYEQDDTWKIGRSLSKTKEEEPSRDFHNQKMKDFPLRTNVNYNEDEEEEEEDDDDATSYASSDLFELDHLAVLGNSRYCEELPVYETTHYSTNRAIANGLIV